MADTTTVAAALAAGVPIPATPRKSVPDARKLTTSGSLRDAIASCCGKAVVTFALASIAVLQADADIREEELMFDNEGEHAPDKPWQTFGNLVADEPNKAVTQPITVMTDVKMALAALLVGVADLVDKEGKLPAVDPLGHLASAPWREANIVQLMLATTVRARHLLRHDPLCRELNYPFEFRRKFEALVASKTLVDPYADAISRLFLDFIKVIAWHAAARAYEQARLTPNRCFTLNHVTFFGILASMEASLSKEESPVVRDVLNLVRTQIGSWKEGVAQAKKLAAPAKKAKPAAPAQKAKPAAPARKLAAPAKKAEPAAPAKKAEPAAPAKKAAPAAPAKKAAPAAEAGQPATPKTAAVFGVAAPVAPELDYDNLLAEINDGVS
jgi:hypothetical protein